MVSILELHLKVGVLLELVLDLLIHSKCNSSTAGFLDISSLGTLPKIGMKITNGIILYFTQGNFESSLSVTVPQ